MKLTLGFSPCPNDTFIFDALIHKKFDTAGLEFEPLIEDVETLNEWALEGRLDITKLSLPAFFRSSEEYLLLNSGSAMGNGVGPLLITNQPEELPFEAIKKATVVLPGENTTAHLLFSMAFPDASNKIFLRFDEIEDHLLANPDHIGVIIHENRFTYELKGLKKIADLGEFWETEMHLPLPLGAIAINQSVKRSTALKVDQLIQKSIRYSSDRYPDISDFVRNNAQSMSEDVMKKHIELYVNDFSLDLGESGRYAISAMFDIFRRINKITDDPGSLFLK